MSLKNDKITSPNIYVINIIITITITIIKAGPDGSFVSTGACIVSIGGTRFESRSGRIFAIVVVHIQCSELFKGMECTVSSMVLRTIKNRLKIFEIRVPN